MLGTARLWMGIVAGLHVAFALAEMLLWETLTPRDRKSVV